MIINVQKKRIYVTCRVTNISKSFTHKMAAKISWHTCGTKLRHCHHIREAGTALKHCIVVKSRAALSIWWALRTSVSCLPVNAALVKRGSGLAGNMYKHFVSFIQCTSGLYGTCGRTHEYRQTHRHADRNTPQYLKAVVVAGVEFIAPLDTI